MEILLIQLVAGLLALVISARMVFIVKSRILIAIFCVTFGLSAFASFNSFIKIAEILFN